MAVRKRGKNWVVDYRIDGKRFVRVVGPRKHDAIAVEGKVRAQVREGKFFDCHKTPPRMTLDELIARYVDCSPKHATITELMHLRTIRTHFAADRLIHEIRKIDVDDFQAARLLVPSKRGGKRNMATVNRELGALRRLLNTAVAWELIDRNPAAGRKSLPETKGRVRFLSLEEARNLLGASSPHLRPIILCALETGMRRGEIFGLHWEDVDLVRRLLYIGRTKNGIPRHVPVSTRLCALFDMLRSEAESGHVFRGKPKVGGTGKPFHDVRTSFENACRRAGITGFRFHDLRHTAASHMVMAGVPLKTVAEILGHATTAMTERYSHLLPEHKLKAVEMLPEWA